MRNLKVADNCTDFYWMTGDTIKIRALGAANQQGNLGRGSKQEAIVSGTLPQDCGDLIIRPGVFFTLQLKAGYNLISLPLYPVLDEQTGQEITHTSYSLLDIIPGCLTVTDWNPNSQFYDTAYMDEGQPYGENFPILLGRSYFVLVESPVELTFYGRMAGSPNTLDLKYGYNFSSLIYAPNMPGDSFTGYTSHRVMTDIPALYITGWNSNSQFYDTAYYG